MSYRDDGFAAQERADVLQHELDRAEKRIAAISSRAERAEAERDWIAARLPPPPVIVPPTSDEHETSWGLTGIVILLVCIVGFIAVLCLLLIQSGHGGYR